MTVTITYSLEKDARMGWSTHMVRVDGVSICGITDQTPIEAVQAFVKLAHENDAELGRLVKAAEAKRDWNIAESNAGRMGKDWPEFRELERFKAKRLKQAGVVDS